MDLVVIYFYKDSEQNRIYLEYFKKNIGCNYRVIEDESTFVPEIGKQYRFVNSSKFGPNVDGEYITLTNTRIISNSPIHFFMMYYKEEPLAEYGIYHEFMTFIKLEPQTVYFESNGFRLIKSIPNVEYIGILTPSLYRKTKLSIDDIIDKVKKNPNDLTPLYYGGQDLMEQAKKCHGHKFEIIWKWLLNKLSLKPKNIKTFYSNLWVLKTGKFHMYLSFVKKIFNILDNAPDEIKILLESDANYCTGIVKPIDLLKNTGFPYYTFYPFIMERIICLFNDSILSS